MKLQSVEEFFHKRETVEKYNVDKIIKLNWECPDVLFSFRGVYAIGVFIYYRQLFGDNVKTDIKVKDEKGATRQRLYVVPILVGLKIVDISLYNQFVCGKSSKPLMDIYKDSDKGEWLATRLLNRNEAFEVEEGKSVVTVEQKIQQLYDAIFVTEYTGNVYHTILGEYEFDDNSKNFVKSVESMLSVYADYNI